MEIIIGVASTTHLDRNNDKITKKCLEGMARKINSVYVPLKIEHKGAFIGVLLCAVVKQLQDGEFGLYTAIGKFADIKEKADFLPFCKKSNTVGKNYMHLIEKDIEPCFLKNQLSLSISGSLEPPFVSSQSLEFEQNTENHCLVIEIDKDDKKALIDYLKTENINATEDVRKSFDAPTAISIIASSVTIFKCIWSVIQYIKGNRKPNHDQNKKQEIKITIDDWNNGLSKEFIATGYENHNDVDTLLKDFYNE